MVHMARNCPKCKSSTLSVLNKKEKIRARGGSVTARLTYTSCNSCKFKFVTPEQAKLNDAAAQAARRDAL